MFWPSLEGFFHDRGTLCRDKVGQRKGESCRDLRFSVATELGATACMTGAQLARHT